MITVRFQTGVSVTYNHAHYALWLEDGRTKLFTAQGGTFVALVPASAIVEFSTPCKFENPIEGKTIEAAIRLLTADPKGIRTAPSYFVKKLKLLLCDFNAKTFTWRNPQ